MSINSNMVSPSSSSHFHETLGIYVKEAKFELIKLAREPMYTLFVIGFPIIFFCIFGLPSMETEFHGYPLPRYLIASYSCFGSMGAALFAIGSNTAFERGRGWVELKRAFPMPPSAYILAKVVAATFFSLSVTIILLILGKLSVNLQISPTQALHLIFSVLGSMVLFASLGILAGLAMSPSNAGGMINLIYLPLSLCSGLWMPLESLPGWLQKIAPLLPSYYASRLALHSLGYFDDNEMTIWLIMAGYSLIFLTVSIWLFKRQESVK